MSTNSNYYKLHNNYNVTPQSSTPLADAVLSNPSKHWLGVGHDRGKKRKRKNKRYEQFN